MAIVTPISEQFRLIALKWCDAEHAAKLMEETRSSFLSELITKIIGENIKIPFNKAELAAKSSTEYKNFITEMVQYRKDANLLKVQMETLRMRFSEEQSDQANARAERRL